MNANQSAACTSMSRFPLSLDTAIRGSGIRKNLRIKKLKDLKFDIIKVISGKNILLICLDRFIYCVKVTTTAIDNKNKYHHRSIRDSFAAVEQRNGRHSPPESKTPCCNHHQLTET